jgi:hypothetical protein
VSGRTFFAGSSFSLSTWAAWGRVRAAVASASWCGGGDMDGGALVTEKLDVRPGAGFLCKYLVEDPGYAGCHAAVAVSSMVEKSTR